MSEIREICVNCGDKYCCRGLCREMNDYLVSRKEESYEKKRLSRSGTVCKRKMENPFKQPEKTTAKKSRRKMA